MIVHDDLSSDSDTAVRGRAVPVQAKMPYITGHWGDRDRLPMKLGQSCSELSPQGSYPSAERKSARHSARDGRDANRLGDETPARRTAQRLINKGLDRHEAIHAIGIIEFMSDLIDKAESR